MKCKWCGFQGDEFGLAEIVGYDWAAAENGDEDALSIRGVLGHQCVNRTECARQIVEQGNNIEALRMVAADYENLGGLAVQASERLSQWCELYRDIAAADEAAAREQGYGAIGGGVPL